MNVRLPYHRVENTLNILSNFEKAWYYDKMRLGAVHKITKGEGVVIGVLDTGVDKNHPELKGNVLSTRDFTAEGYGRINPHASHVAGIIVGNKKITGVAPEAKIRDYKVLRSNGSGNSQAVARAINQAVRDGCDVLNLSLGSDGLSPQIKKAIESATERGVIVVCAAGNDGTDIDYPAAFPETIAVAALDYRRNWIIADFSSPSIGKKVVDVSAPGVNVLSSIPNNRYARYSGTCLSGSSRIPTIHGNKEIRDIEIGDTVFSLNEDTQTLEESKVLDKISNGVKKVFRLKTRHNEIVCTDNHPFLVFEGTEDVSKVRGRYSSKLVWKELKDISEGDVIVAVDEIPEPTKAEEYAEFINGELIKIWEHNQNSSLTFRKQHNLPDKPVELTEDLMKLMGCFIGDGNLLKDGRSGRRNYSAISIHLPYGDSKNKNLANKYKKLMKRVFGEEPKDYNGTLNYYSVYACDIFSKLFELDKDCYSKRVPQFVYGLPNRYKKAVLAGILDSDGHLQKNNNFNVELTNPNLVKDIEQLLLSVGNFSGNITTRQREEVYIGDRKLNAKPTYCLNCTLTHSLPIESDRYNVEVERRNSSMYVGAEVRKYRSTPLYKHLKNSRYITATKVISIEEEGYEEVYDITVDGNHNFIAEGIIVHNSMATPVVTGIVALLLSAQQPDRTKVKEILTSTAIDLENVGFSAKSGWGVVNPAKIFGLAITDKMITKAKSIWDAVKSFFRIFKFW